MPGLEMSKPTMNLEELRPPVSIEAEQSVLGGLLIDPDAWEKIADVIDAGDFYAKDNRLIFEAIKALENDNEPVDIVTVSERLNQQRGRLDDVGGVSYVGSLAANVPTSANIQHYARIVRERSMLRSLIGVGVGIEENARNPNGKTAMAVVEEAEKELFALTNGNRSQDFADVVTTVESVIETIEQHYESGDPVTGLSTGLSDLDKMTGGFQDGNLVILAARPSMGKTALALGIALSALMKYPEGGIQFYSMEMTAKELVTRLLSQIAKLTVSDLIQGSLSNQLDWEKLTAAVETLSNQGKRLAIDETPTLTPMMLRAKARRAARKFGAPRLIVVDYLQLMQTESAGENRNAELTEISRSLKELAKEMNCPVLALSQLNRNLESRPNKRPLMSDIRESGAIEQDANVIIFIYRDEVYNPESPQRGTAELIIAKQRNGAIGTVRAAFLAPEARFANLDSYDQPAR
jgi:replicative DNA helicase